MRQHRQYAAALAEYSVNLDLDTVPEEVTDHAKYLLLDLLGATLAGVDTPEADAALTRISHQ